MPRSQRLQALVREFSAKTVLDLPSIREALGGVSAMTAFRYLGELDYRRSYNRNGGSYALFDATRFDQWGLWSWEGSHFSVDCSLRATVRRMVREAAAGATHRELQERLQVRVQNTLAGLLRDKEVDRERPEGVFVYLHVDPEVRRGQLRHRNDLIDQASTEREVNDKVVIQVLLEVIRHPGARAADVVRHLRGHSPPISFEQVGVVFSRYGLGEKGGL